MISPVSMARTGWVYAGGDEDGEVERSEEDNIMEAEIGDFVHDDIYGRVQLWWLACRAVI